MSAWEDTLRELRGQFVSGSLARVKRLRELAAALRANPSDAALCRNLMVLFHGMAGAGKTTCALELVYCYQTGRFQECVWYRAPEAEDDIGGALGQFAIAMERKLPGLAMVHLVERAEEFAAWLPRLTERLKERSTLLVLDNLESLLTPEGKWRDARWGQLVGALLAHRGFSRTVFTSRVRPVEVEATRLLVEPIHALSLGESVVLARELPNLRKLPGSDDGRKLLCRTLAVVQGHPKLIELADGQAGDPKALAAHLDRAAAAWAGDEGRLEAFFTQGESSFDAQEFLEALAGWTRGVAAALPPASRHLFFFLCALEVEDREEQVVETVWPQLWPGLKREGDAPDLGATLAPVISVGLVDLGHAGYAIHPGVAEAGREEAGAAFQATVDMELAAFWWSLLLGGQEAEEQGSGPLIVRAGLAVAPYLVRQRQWYAAAGALEQVICRHQSPESVAEALPLVRRIAQEMQGTEHELQTAGVLAHTLRWAGLWREAEVESRRIVEQALAREEFRTAFAALGDLINLLRDTGRPKEGSSLVDEMKECARQANLGPWTQLGNEGTRLQLLADIGRYEEVLSAVGELRELMQVLSTQDRDGVIEEAMEPWNVREGILDIGRAAALGLGRSEEALALNAEIIVSAEARGAAALQLADIRLNDYGPLLRLSRYKEARELLLFGRSVYESEGDARRLGRAFSALAQLEGTLGHHKQAVTFEATALRYKYAVGSPEECAISHNNLAIHLLGDGTAASISLAHRLAAMVIVFQAWSGHLATHLPALAAHVGLFAQPPLPRSFDELCENVEQVEGVHFRELFARLPLRAPDGDAALQEVLRLAREAGTGGSGQGNG